MGLLVCAALPACTDDADSVGNKLTEGKAYIKVQIAMPSTSTRATEGNYENGSDTEQKISDLYFAFYDNSGNFMADGKNVQNLIPSSQTNGSNVEAITDAVIALELEEKDNFPTQVVAYVNTPKGADNKSVFSGKTLSQARELVEQSTTYATADNFMMTNSTYYQGGEKFATPVVPANFYETEDMAKADNNPVKIYVERLAAKVRVAAATSGVTIPDLTDKSGNTLKFNITAFALNATNTKAYYLKHIPSDWTESIPAWNWNKATDFRCFWAEDVNYTATNDGDLTFVSYNDVKDNTTSFSAYCRENTFAYASMVGENVNPYKIATHALVLGKYVVTDKDDKEIGDAEGTFYMYGGTVYDADNLKKLLAPSSLVFTKSGDAYVAADPSVYGIVAVSGSASDVCLQLTLTDGTTYYTESGDTFVAIDATNIDTVNTALAQVKAEGFNAGLAYFPVIIEHFGGVAGTDSNEKTGDGAYGVVRNHIYDLTIQSIKSLGTGIFDETQPIIPDGSTKKYYVGAKLNILSWKVVRQNVNL
ncbi:MAG: Mfa1 family fimbria major subunit [Bacteroides sp.]